MYLPLPVAWLNKHLQSDSKKLECNAIFFHFSWLALWAIFWTSWIGPYGKTRIRK